MDDLQQSQLRLASARRRLASFIEQIAELKSSNFPHDDGERALELIHVHFMELAREVAEIDDDTRADLVDRWCVNVTAQVANSIVILGLILRSTNVRNPFELHYALAETVRKYIGDDVRVLVSSEWTYTPFTWPMNFDILPAFVIIGTPASESSNALVAPLAGHEIGHTAWRRFSDIAEAVAKGVGPAVEAELARRAEQQLLDELKIGPLGRRVAIERCAEHASKQIEEIFCDLFGLYLFGSAYLDAYDYLVAPGNIFATLDYPSDGRRIKILSVTAAEWGIPVARVFDYRWTTSPPHPDQPILDVIVTAVVEQLVPIVRDMLFSEMGKRGLDLPNAAVVDLVHEAFGRAEPYDGRATLAEIVIAGWRRLWDVGGLSGPGDRDELHVLNDLMLKTIEVTEYRERTDTHA